VFLDRKSRELVLRVAYAGQPLSGKTQSIRALGPLLKGTAMPADVFSPNELYGRTLYFDWAGYLGGSFRGNRIRCQIVTVPGQETLRRRRQWLVERSDVVVFVVDSEAHRLLDGHASYRELLPWLERNGRAPIPVVFQCNKRDLPSAVELSRIRDALGIGASESLFETTATDGRGVRAVFVGAMRAAVAYADALDDRALTQHRPDAASGEQMLELMQRVESGEPEHVAADALQAGGIAKLREAEGARKADEAYRAGREREEEVARRAEEARKAEETRRANEARSAEQARERVEAQHNQQAIFEKARREAQQQRHSAAAGRWSGDGPRPAVMPAAEWRKLQVAAKPAGESAPTLEPQVPQPQIPQPKIPGPQTSVAQPTFTFSSTSPATSANDVEPPRPRVLRINLDQHVGPRPAVMPASAWRARLKAKEDAALPLTSVPTEQPLPETSAADGAITVVVPVLTEPVLEPATPENTTNAADSAAAEYESVILPRVSPAAEDAWPAEIWKDLGVKLHAGPREAVWQDGTWSGEIAPDWRASSANLFGDRETAHEALAIEITRRERLEQFVWPHRCLVLCADDSDYWRLWEAVLNAPTLELILQRIMTLGVQVPLLQTAGKLVAISQAYLRACNFLAGAPEGLLATFRSIAPHTGRFVYSGFLNAEPLDQPVPPRDAMMALETEIRLHLTRESARSIDVPGVCRELEKLLQAGAQKQIVELLSSVLLGH